MAVIVSVSLGSSTARHAYRELYESLAGRAALEVVAEGGGTFDRSVADELARVPGVRGDVPLLQRYGLIYVRHKRIQVLVLGVDPVEDRLAPMMRLRRERISPPGMWRCCQRRSRTAWESRSATR